MRWFGKLTSDQRTRLLSIAGAVVLVVLCATSAAVLINTTTPFRPTQDNLRIGVGAQPGVSESASPGTSLSPGASPGALSGPSAGVTPAGALAVKATYKTIALLGVGGFDTEVTVTNPDSAAWTVVLVMPEDKPVENRSAAVVKMVQDGTKVTLTPSGAPGRSTSFTIRYPALLALGKAVTSCTVNARPCEGI